MEGKEEKLAMTPVLYFAIMHKTSSDKRNSTLKNKNKKFERHRMGDL